MNLVELTTKLQTLCHEGHSLDEVLIDIDGKNENFADIKVRRVNVLGEKPQISLVAWRR